VVATVYTLLKCINLNQGGWHFLLLKLDHLKSIGKFDFSNSCALWTSWLSQQFLRIYWSRIRPHSQKIMCCPWLFLQVCKSVKILELEKYLFQGSKQSYMNQFPDLADFWVCLTVGYIWNTIFSRILEVRLRMSLRLKCNVCRSLGNTPCLVWISGEFVIVGTIS
jgi:hypothetical protein